MSPPHPPTGAGRIDVDDAWTLVLAARPGAGRPVALALRAGGPAVIEVRPGCAWDNTTDVTLGAEPLDLYLPLCATPGPGLALAEVGQSLDGRIATTDGHSHFVNGRAGTVHLRRLRALVDAVVVSATAGSAAT